MKRTAISANNQILDSAALTTRSDVDNEFSENSFKIGVAIVNYKTPRLVVNCLFALAADRGEGMVVVIVDNDSADGSVEILQESIDKNQWQSWVKLIACKKNLGFSYGNNRAFEILKNVFCVDYIWMLNPDTLPAPNAAITLVRALVQSPEIGIVGSRLQDVDGSAQVSAFNYPSLLGEFLGAARLGVLDRWLGHKLVTRPIAHEAIRADWLAGASLMFPSGLLQATGPMDEEYFLYFEEVDFCRRVQEAGYEIWQHPESVVTHMVGASTGISETRKKGPRRPAYWFKSRRRYFVKNHGVLYALAADIAWVAGYVLWMSRRWLSSKENLDPPKFMRDFLTFSFGLDRKVHRD